MICQHLFACKRFKWNKVWNFYLKTERCRNKAFKWSKCIYRVSKYDDVYENIHDYNSSRKRIILIVFDDMIASIMTNKRFQAIIKKLFIICRKLSISLVFITQSYFTVPKDVRLNSTLYLIMKINNKRESQNIVINHSADIDYGDFMKIYR